MERPFPVSQIADNLLIMKEPQAKDQIQYGTVRSFEKTSERSSDIPHKIPKTYKGSLRILKACFVGPL